LPELFFFLRTYIRTNVGTPKFKKHPSIYKGCRGCPEKVRKTGNRKQWEMFIKSENNAGNQIQQNASILPNLEMR
ncbi:MAG: hypothetical protein PHD00_08685, partial [Bacteroidales bacterium]|nr:hypothetical protein [Bacteroidales bacterium]